MIDVKSCPECGAELPADAPEGLCPHCLLLQGVEKTLETPVREPVATGIYHGPVAALDPAELAPHFPQLEILELLGQGGMGAVYKARQLKLDRLVALKILSAEAGRDPAFAERFMREARALARLNHPHIVTVYDFGETNGLFYFLMEHVDGMNLRQLLQAGGLKPAETLKIVPQICDALHYAHEEDVVHRDIKPENILLDRKGRAKIADFGLAKLVGLTPTYLTLTGSHQVMGTLYYMAPEQMERPHTVDHRADLYSLGVVFYEMLTGELPLGRFAPPSHKARIDERLDSIVLRALSKEPEKRYQDANELKSDLEAVSARGPAARPAPGGSPAVEGSFLALPFSTDSYEFKGKEYEARGLIRLEEKTLVLEYVVGKDGEEPPPGAELKEVKIPLTNIASIALETGWFPNLVVRASRLSTLAGIPTGSQGQIKLYIARKDSPAAEELVAAVMRKPRSPAAPRSVLPAGNLPGRAADLDLIRFDIKGPAGGLMVTGILAILTWSVLLTVIPVYSGYDAWNRYPVYQSLGRAFPWLMPIVFTPAIILLFGALKMRKLEAYDFAITASILALVPWSPAFLIGVPMGIWSLFVLGRREVKAAFAQTFNPRCKALENLADFASECPAPRPRGLLLGPVKSFVRSVRYYCYDSLLGSNVAPPPPRVEPEDINTRVGAKKQ